ncbi:unnamed protein product [Dibothriocephalus latus]|uniref:BACK domain-containing protein n=1 Tax=Dibothriocephalus latus TaxID=60516 RepID=A0A3P7NJ79_DIBLA|nr:unnamed protein product [Dibothriocephalus latus]
MIVLSQQLEMPQVEKWAVGIMTASVKLRDACLDYMKATFEATVARNFFIQLPADTVLSLLEADDLQVDSEETVLKAIGRWVSPLGKVDETRFRHAEAMMKQVQ